MEETLGTLDYAECAKNTENKPEVSACEINGNRKLVKFAMIKDHAFAEINIHHLDLWSKYRLLRCMRRFKCRQPTPAKGREDAFDSTS
ncbi:hypothetical protein Tco_0838344 [Tanacetum coccineum]|uniref:Uncharacterized protein n=1 Tax=Tanacetum coccineum TaxID=301880 RepID=A0ABQ5AQT4_9ASTR